MGGFPGIMPPPSQDIMNQMVPPAPSPGQMLSATMPARPTEATNRPPVPSTPPPIMGEDADVNTVISRLTKIATVVPALRQDADTLISKIQEVVPGLPPLPAQATLPEGAEGPLQLAVNLEIELTNLAGRYPELRHDVEYFVAKARVEAPEANNMRARFPASAAPKPDTGNRLPIAT